MGPDLVCNHSAQGSCARTSISCDTHNVITRRKYSWEAVLLTRREPDLSCALWHPFAELKRWLEQGACGVTSCHRASRYSCRRTSLKIQAVRHTEFGLKRVEWSAEYLSMTLAQTSRAT